MTQKMVVLEQNGQQKAIDIPSTTVPFVLLEIDVVNGELIANYLVQLTPTLVNGELLVDIL